MQRLIVLCGGTSDERAVSLRSGAAVAEALRDGRRDFYADSSTSHAVEVVVLDPAETDLESYAFGSHDLCVNVLHGAFGEDGGVQELLAARGVRMTGCDAAASRLTFSKLATRSRLEAAGLPIPLGEAITAESPLPTAVPYPIVVKPDRSGSSVGLHLVRGPDEWVAARDDACRYDPEGCGLMEECLGGCEWTVSVLDRDPLPPIEVRSPRMLFDASAKYADDATEFVPIDADRVDARAMQSLAVAAAEACGTRGLVRVDLRTPKRDAGDYRVLEINTVPGMTARSLSPLAAMAAGMSLPELVYWTVNNAR